MEKLHSCFRFFDCSRLTDPGKKSTGCFVCHMTVVISSRRHSDMNIKKNALYSKNKTVRLENFRKVL